MKYRAVATLIVMQLILFNSCRKQKEAAQPNDGNPYSIAVIFEVDGDQRFEAIIKYPAAADDNGWCVLMIGGGYGNDLNWTTPGKIEVDGIEQQLSIDGTSHTDAPRIADALVGAGFVVMHYSTIALDDPMADQWPLRTSPRTLPELNAIARAALAKLQSETDVELQKIILLGHSLGAARACTIAADEPTIAGLILLAPAYFANDSELLEKNELIWGQQVVEQHRIPTLALFGATDKSSAVAQQAAHDLSAELTLTVKTFPALGHNLGFVSGERTGPIENSVLETITLWAENLVGDEGSQ